MTYSRQSVLDYVVELVSEHFQAHARSIDGARIAKAIRSRFPSFDPKDLGLGDHWVGELVRQAEADSLIRRDASVRHLAVFPFGVTPPTTAVDPSDSAWHIEPNLWQALVFVNAREAHYDPKLRRIAIGPANDAQIPVPKIAAATQQEWATEFLGREGLDVSDAPIDAPDWWLAFPAWLREHQPLAENRWKKFRTAHVVHVIRQWAEQNHIPIEDLLSRPTARGKAAAVADADGEQKVRGAILSVVGELSTDDLLELRIPLREVVKHFVPR